MSTITKERVAQFIKNPLDNGLTRGEQMELARIALASLEAEPVAYMHRSGQVVTREECCDDKTFAICCKVETPLYTAPPAKVSVPDAYIRDERGRMMLNGRPEPRIGYGGGWNACRAAMLQGADGNSPAIPDGWVACSERMPDENAEQEVLACFKGGDISTLYYFDGRWDDAYGIVPIRQDVTHWMPLPLPPTK